MEVFLDTASVEEIKKFEWLIDGVTTNPSLVSKEGMKVDQALTEISKIVSGPISVEVVSDTYEEMLEEGKLYTRLVDNAVIKLPITIDGLKVCKKLSSIGIATNMTLCFSVAQAVLAAKCGATYVSPFLGRIDDIGYSGISVIEDICSILHRNFSTKVLAASIRSLDHILDCFKCGVDAVTIPVDIMDKMVKHPLTNEGILKFKNDYSKVISQI